ncbi:class A beta-lactamase-related serine hydrolase [Paraflavitalea soli]|uniref:Class A beta-lactamase-related serine hydrolase n=1 Tax=Paraflavitalea soli TaxID=2315862 RepID=A0A3B7MY74_9BACT|nr:serine hydrolase domain-containing protein [Paraflavitalea soli]AXY76675.1 class A beta-lactamase-related serine hydrolase [Paraflavitalea soli]
MKKLCCIVLLMVGCIPVFSQTFSLMADSIRKYRGVPGLVYAVFDADKILDIGASGVREFRKKDSIRITDRFYTGTNTTAFTAYLAARLADAGKLQWNTTVLKALPEINGKTMKLYHSVTIRQLLAQRAGIRPYTEAEDQKGIPLLTGSKPEQRRAFATLVMKGTPLLIVDSSQPVYSVAGTAIAAAMMEKITGKAWEELIGQYISKPLNLSIRFGLPRLADSLQPYGHGEIAGVLQPEFGHTTIPAIAPATDINISIKDYILFMQDMLKALQHKKSVISSIAAEQLLSATPGMAMGWENETWNKLRINHFLGKSALFSTYTMIIREKNIGIIVLCNSGTVSGKSAVLNFGRMLREYYCQ